MSQAILVCPEARQAVGHLAASEPLGNVMLLGETVAGYWIREFAIRGYSEVRVLAADRPEQIENRLGDGRRWGVKVRVEREMEELDEATAMARYGKPGDATAVADRLPRLEHLPLFQNYAGFFQAGLAWVAKVREMERVGVREIGSGVTVGMRSVVDPQAELRGPVWLGEHVRVGPGAVIGPNVILEDQVVVEGGAEIRESLVGRETFIGSLTTIRHSLAFGSMLIDWRTGSCTMVPDEFLMCALNGEERGWRERVKRHFRAGAGRVTEFLGGRFGAAVGARRE